MVFRPRKCGALKIKAETSAFRYSRYLSGFRAPPPLFLSVSLIQLNYLPIRPQMKQLFELFSWKS